MRFSDPVYLLLLLALAWFWWSGPRATAPGRRRMRCTIVALLVAAASGLQVMWGEAPLGVMFVVDVSGSMAAARAGVQQRLDRLLAGLRQEDSAGIVVFGARPVVERPPGEPAPVRQLMSEVDDSSTDIESALRLARARLPIDRAGRIVLLSDGHETRGDAMREAAFAAAAGVPVDVAPPPSGNRAPVRVVRVGAPATVALEEPFALTVVAQGPAGETAQLVVRNDGEEVLREDVQFSADGFATANRTIQAGASGVQVYLAEVIASQDLFADTAPPAAGAVVAVSGEPRVLYIGDRRAWLDSVLSPAFAIASVAPARLDPSPAALARYDAIVLDDVSPDVLSDAQIAALGHAVETRGSGLLVLGGEQSLDASLVPDAGLGRLLPIDLRPRAGARAPEVALVVVFDKSGSMDDRVEGSAKIEFARQGVRRVVDAVPPTDAVGIIAFDDDPEAVAPLQRGLDGDAVAERLRAIEPSGSTAIAPALRLASEWLSAPEHGQIARRHVLLVSDGRSSDGDLKEVEALARTGAFQLSVISIGDDASAQAFAALAASTGGRAYFPGDARDLPLILAREAARVAGGRTVEEAFRPIASAHPITRGIDPELMPQLTGYVVSAARPASAVILRSHREDPILAAWRAGLGRVAVYTAGLQSAWSSRLRTSEINAPLLLRSVRWLSRSSDDQLLYTRFEDRGTHTQMLVDVHDSESGFLSLLDAAAAVRTPSGRVERVPLTESLAGRYEGRIPTTDPGAYVASLSLEGRDGGFDRQILRGFYWSGGSERRASGVNAQLLSQLAQSTGGKQIEGDDPFRDRPTDYRDLRPWLLATAFLLFLAELLAPAVLRRRRAREASANQEAAA